MITIAEKPHSLLGPSSFERVAACSASAIVGAGLAPVSSSEYAAEGTVCHEVMEKVLVDGAFAFDFIGETFRVGEHEIEFDAELCDVVMEVVDFVRVFKTQRKRIETRLSLPGDLIWGWADVVIVDRPLIVVDLKAGAGIEVPGSAKQLGLYGLMAVLEEEGADRVMRGFDAEVLVNAVVAQPRSRVKVLKPHGWTRGELKALWVEAVEVADRVRRKEVHYAVGRHCRWCPVLELCPALRVAAKDAALAEVLPDPKAISDTDFNATALDNSIALLPALALWMKRIKEVGEAYLRAGGQLQNLKIVPSRASRQWTDDKLAEAAMKKFGVDPFQPRQLLSPNMFQEKAGKKIYDQLPAGLVEMVSKGTSVAFADDKRQAIGVAPAVAVNRGLAADTARALLGKAHKTE